MAVELATAYVSLVPSMDGFTAKLKAGMGPAAAQAGNSAGIESGKSFGGSFGATLKKVIGPALAIMGAGAIASFASTAVASFSQLEDSTGAASVVFGDSMDAIIEQSKTASSTLGMSSSQVINAANTFGTYGKSAGLAGDDLAGFSTEMTTLAGDMASFKGTSPEQAIEAIGAALRGESEPIRAYGVMLDDATLKARAMEMGIYDGTAALTPQQKALAAQAEILAQTTDAQGDFLRTQDSTANVAATLSANMENLRARIGEGLAPAFTAVKGTLSDMIGAFLEAPNSVAGISAAFSSLKDSFGEGGFMAGIVDAVKGAIDGVVTWLSTGGITSIFNTIINSRTQMFDAAMVLFPALIDGLVTVLPQIVTFITGQLIPGIVNLLITSLPVLVTAAVSMFNGLIQGFVTILPQIVAAVVTLIPAVVGALVAALPALLAGAVSLFTAIVQAIPIILPVIIEGIIAILPPLLAALITMIPTLLQTAITVFMAIVRAVIDVAPKVLGMITGTLIPGILSSVGTAIGPMLTKGKEVLDGFWNGIKDKWESVKSWFGDIPSKVSGAVGNLGSTLKSAGRAIIEGFWNGLKEKFEAVKDWVGGIGDWIANNKGPKAYDLALLKPAGGWIMEGLQAGLRAEIPNLSRTLRDVTGAMQVGVVGAGAMSVGGFAASAAPNGLTRADLDYLANRIGYVVVDGATRVADGRIVTAGQSQAHALTGMRTA